MIEKKYILIGTEDKNATFIIKGDPLTYFEIFQLDNTIETDINSLIVVNAINQQEALKKLKLNYPNLMKYATKNYYERTLII